MTHSAQFKRLTSALLLGWAIAAGASSRLAAQCVGDCNGDGTVRIPEVQRCVNIRSGAQLLSSCVNADQNHDGSVSPTEVDRCIESFLDAATCPRVLPTNTAAVATSTATVAVPTATRTTSPTASRTSTPVPTNSPTNPPPPTLTPTNSPPAATNTPQVRTCAFNGATDDSSLQICFLGVCPAAIDISGSMQLSCGDPSTQNANGQRNCQCALQSLNPFVLAGVGTICAEPATGACPDGKLDCDGGSSLGVDTIADSDIGTCSGNTDCRNKCATTCTGLGYSVYTAACESFCQGGTRADQSCKCDLASGATCSGGVAGVNDCPGGSCEGKDNEADIDCHCTCLNDAFGSVSPAGAMQCRLGVSIRVEADPVCDNNQVLVRLPGQCAPFSSSSVQTRILETNESAGSLGPYSDTGTSGTCVNLDAGSIAAYTLVSDLAFFDSTIGDLIARLKLDCQ